VVRKILSQNLTLEKGTEVLQDNESGKSELKLLDYFSAPNLQFEIIKFLNGVSEFKYVPGIVLVELAKITSFIKFKEGDQIKVYESKDDLDYYLVRTGKVVLLNEEGEIDRYQERGLLHNFNLMDLNDEPIKLVAGSDCEIYKIKQEEFNEVMSFYDAISFSIINNIKKGNSKAKSLLPV
jgi:signal-transduction protein with cAMP-binding, CBS, and nucleotidyltransferase domain